MSTARRPLGMPGESVLRKEDHPLLTGRSCFVDDLNLPGSLHAAFLRSPHAHARIRAIDAASALERDDVIEVITAADLPGRPRIPMRMWPRPGMERYLQPPLAEGTVRYSGEPVAVVVAHSRYAAEDALDAVRVDYEPLAPVLHPEAALEAGAPLLFPETGSNAAASFTIAHGELDAAFESADVVVEERVSCGRHAAVPMETRGLAAQVDPGSGRLTVWGAAKIVHVSRRILARLLDWPLERIRLVELHVGGGFGARGEFYPEDFLIPFCAIRLDRPVSWTGDRAEDLAITNHSREQVHHIALALAKDGTFLGLRDRVYFNTGGYVRTHGTVVPGMTAALLPGPYNWPAYSCEIDHVVTNKTPAGTYRAPGRYEANFARERIIDVAAHKLDIDPVELRRKNLVAASGMPHDVKTTTDGHPVVYDSGNYPLLLKKALKQWDPKAMAAWRRADPGAGRRRGLGVGYFVEKAGIGRWDWAQVSLTSEGRPLVRCGTASIGQGVETVLAQLCAEALGVPYDDIVAVEHGDTDVIPDGMGAFGSRATMIAGTAVFNAATALRERILDVAAELLEAAPEDLELVEDKVSVRGSRSRGVTLFEISEAAQPANATARGAEPGVSEEAYFNSDDMSFPYGVHFVAVDVDTETGAVTLARYLVAYDVGRAINPQLIEGQIVGGAAQGAGGALLEEFGYDEQGQLVSGSFMDYLMPTALEAPAVEVLLTEDAPTPLTPIGAKGAGEGGTAAAGAAIANAVSDALGAEVTALPLTPERVVKLAAEGRRGK